MNKYLIPPDAHVKLSDFDANDASEFAGDKKAAKDELKQLTDEMDELQERLYAENKRAVLFVIQAMDTGGKDGTIRKVFSNLNPAGCEVSAFKQPSSIELEHDYLWRIHKVVPSRGWIGVFNRSHYEDVLIVRVHKLVAQETWEQRYAQINAFEKMLTEEGTTIVKIFLNISKDEQKARLQSRLDNPTKQWKFNPGDLKERALWHEYQHAYQDIFNKTSTAYAPWYVIPANRKWYRDIIVARIVHQTLKSLDPQYPKPVNDLSRVVIE